MIKGFFSLRYVFHTSEGVVCAWHSKLKGDYVIDMHRGWWHRTWFCLRRLNSVLLSDPLKFLSCFPRFGKGTTAPQANQLKNNYK